MDKFVKIVDGHVVYAPNNYKTKDGKSVINFHLNQQLLESEGFKPLIQNDMPSEDGYRFVATYEDKGDNIEQNWTKVKIQTVDELSEEKKLKQWEKLAEIEEQAKKRKQEYEAWKKRIEEQRKASQTSSEESSEEQSSESSQSVSE